MTDDDLGLERPTPDPAFRGGLGRRVLAAWTPSPRPAGLRAWVAGLATAGCVLLAAAITQI
jgi:hypothetical protein